MSAPFLKKDHGFSLIELMVAVTIASILLAVSFAAFSTLQRSARDTQRKNDLQTVAGVLQQFYTNYAQYPQTSTGQISYNSTSCTGTINVNAAWGTGRLECGGKSYTKGLPKEPLASNPQYCYLPLNGNQRYELYTRLEKSTGNTYTPGSCGLSGGQNYNFRITSSD